MAAKKRKHTSTSRKKSGRKKKVYLAHRGRVWVEVGELASHKKPKKRRRR